jgi:hypothetical protein
MGEGEVHPFAQERLDVGRDVAVFGECLLLGLGARVHHDQGGAGPRGEVGQPWVAQPADVVEHRGPGVQRGTRHGGLPRVDGDAHPLRGEALDEGHDARGLLLGSGRRGVGHARLRPDVDEVGALGDQLESPRHLVLERVQAHRVGEGVVAGVDDPHDQRAPRLHGDGAVAQTQGPRHNV